MMQHSDNLVFLLDVTKYSRQVLQSPNLRRHVYIAAHMRYEERFTSHYRVSTWQVW